DGGFVLGPDEEAHSRSAFEQAPAEIAQPARRVAPLPHLGIDPHLLELNRARRPRGGLGLEQDRPVLDPEPRAPLADLGKRSAAEPVGVALEWIDAELLLVRGRARREQEVEVAGCRFTEAGSLDLGRFVHHVHGLAPAILARLGHDTSRLLPELAHCAILADDHPRRPYPGPARESAAAL